jgi:hypothetical protein
MERQDEMKVSEVVVGDNKDGKRSVLPEYKITELLDWSLDSGNLS